MHVLTCKEHGRKASEETLLRWARMRMVKVLVMALDSDDGGRAMVIMMMKMMGMVIME